MISIGPFSITGDIVEFQTKLFSLSNISNLLGGAVGKINVYIFTLGAFKVCYRNWRIGKKKKKKLKKHNAFSVGSCFVLFRYDLILFRGLHDVGVSGCRAKRPCNYNWTKRIIYFTTFQWKEDAGEKRRDTFWPKDFHEVFQSNLNDRITKLMISVCISLRTYCVLSFNFVCYQNITLNCMFKTECSTLITTSRV